MKRGVSPSRQRTFPALAGLVWVVAVLALGSALPPAGASARALNWQALNQGLRMHASVASLALDPQQPARLYAGLGDGQGLWVSDDAGAGGRVEPALAGRAVFALLSDPAAPGVVLAGSDAGLYRSADHGRTWQTDPGLSATTIFTLAGDGRGGVLAGGLGATAYRAPAIGGPTASSWQALSPLPGATAVLALAAAPRGGALLAGSDGAGLFRSGDGGKTWQPVVEIGPTFVAGLAFGPDGQQALARTRRGLFASHDAGRTWGPDGGEIPGRVDALSADPATGDFYAGTGEGRIYRRPAGRDRWEPWSAGIDRPGLFQALRIGATTGETATPVLAGTAAAAAAARGSRWYAGSEQGLYLSDDGGRTWQAAPGGPGRPAAQALTLAADGTLWLGNRDGASRLRPGDAAWQPSSAGLPPGGVLALGVAGHDPGTLYAGVPGGLYRSDDGGAHWAATTWNQRGVPALVLDPADPGHLWIRAQYERIYESRDRGQTWTARWTGLGLATQVIALAGDPDTPGALYAGANEGFFRSRDRGLTWQSAGPELTGQTIFAVAARPAGGGPSLLYAGATDGAYRSTDGGQHWTRWGEGLAQITVTAFAFAPGDRERVYAGTKYHGVYASSDGGSHWRPAGLPAASVNTLLFGPSGALWAATDRGVYRAG